MEGIFFSTTTASGGWAPSAPPDLILLLSGPPSCGKTSLLFQFALNSIACDAGGGGGHDDHRGSRRYVDFICSRRKLQANPPFLSLGIDPSSDIFSRIRIKYAESEEDINKYFAAFHLHDSFPVAVVVDDFGDFFDQRNCQDRYANARGRDLAIVRTLSLCKDAMLHGNEKSGCKLLLSDTHHGDSARFLFIYKRWVSSIFTIRGDGSGCYLLTNSTHVKGSGSEKQVRTAKYSIALQYLVLEGTTDHAYG